MKTKNVKVKAKDIKQGITIYVSSPFYGIETIKVLSKPYPVYGASSKELIGYAYDIDCKYKSNGKGRTFLDDDGITLGARKNNSRRAFRKMKHAVEWAKKATDIKEIKDAHLYHVQMCEWMDCNDDVVL